MATPASSSSSELQTVKPVRKPAYWGASKASGEPEVVCAPSTDKIKVTLGTRQSHCISKRLQLTTSVLALQAARQGCSPGPPSPDTAKGSAHSWNPFAKNKAPPAAGANAMQQVYTHILYPLLVLSVYMHRTAFGVLFTLPALRYLDAFASYAAAF